MQADHAVVAAHNRQAPALEAQPAFVLHRDGLREEPVAEAGQFGPAVQRAQHIDGIGAQLQLLDHLPDTAVPEEKIEFPPLPGRPLKESFRGKCKPIPSAG